MDLSLLRGRIMAVDCHGGARVRQLGTARDFRLAEKGGRLVLACTADVGELPEGGALFVGLHPVVGVL